jgi:hypothetical protein
MPFRFENPCIHRVSGMEELRRLHKDALSNLGDYEDIGLYKGHVDALLDKDGYQVVANARVSWTQGGKTDHYDERLPTTDSWIGGSQGAVIELIKEDETRYIGRETAGATGLLEYLYSDGNGTEQEDVGRMHVLRALESQMKQASSARTPLKFIIAQADGEEARLLTKKLGYTDIQLIGELGCWVFPRYNVDENGDFPGNRECFHMCVKPVDPLIKKRGFITYQQMMGAFRAVHYNWLWPDADDFNDKQFATLNREAEKCAERTKILLEKYLEGNDWQIPLEG